MKEMVMGR